MSGLLDSASELITITLAQLELERDKAVSIANHDKMKKLQNTAYAQVIAEKDTYKYVTIHPDIFERRIYSLF